MITSPDNVHSRYMERQSSQVNTWAAVPFAPCRLFFFTAPCILSDPCTVQAKHLEPRILRSETSEMHGGFIKGYYQPCSSAIETLPAPSCKGGRLAIASLRQPRAGSIPDIPQLEHMLGMRLQLQHRQGSKYPARERSNP